MRLRRAEAERNISGTATLPLPRQTDGPESNIFIHVAFLSHTKSIRTQKSYLEHWYYLETLTCRVGRITQNYTDCHLQDILSPFQRTRILLSPVNALNSKKQTIIKRSFRPVQPDTRE